MDILNSVVTITRREVTTMNGAPKAIENKEVKKVEVELNELQKDIKIARSINNRLHKILARLRGENPQAQGTGKEEIGVGYSGLYGSIKETKDGLRLITQEISDKVEELEEYI